ncbi:MAG: glutamine-hydrolyzing carbamoyl-phosphate synthase small subunit [Erysipelotrichaceae bacterium]
MIRYLVLEDGSYFEGEAVGYDAFQIGELVFNTGMSGYQEVISDPSYHAQIVTCAFPLTGNYGVTTAHSESLQCEAFGIVVNEMETSVCGDFDLFLKLHKVPGIKFIDTRMLVRKIRSHGVIKASFANSLDEVPALVETLQTTTLKDQSVASVASKKPYLVPNNGMKVGLMDFGVKTNIIRELNKLGCEILVLPPTTTYDEIMALQLDGLVLSNGPGDPKTNAETIAMISKLDNLPIFGICLGHQIIALAHGGDTQKLKFGHRGINHPVLNIATNRVEITSQNHGYAVLEASIQENFTVTHISLNDRSIEGLAHKTLPIFSVQYHPESSPGPHDSQYLFTQFIEVAKGFKYGKA